MLLESPDELAKDLARYPLGHWEQDAGLMTRSQEMIYRLRMALEERDEAITKALETIKGLRAQLGFTHV